PGAYQQERGRDPRKRVRWGGPALQAGQPGRIQRPPGCLDWTPGHCRPGRPRGPAPFHGKLAEPGCFEDPPWAETKVSQPVPSFGGSGATPAGSNAAVIKTLCAFNHTEAKAEQQQQQTVVAVCRPSLTSGGCHASLTPCGQGSREVTGHETHLACMGFWCSETDSLLHVSAGIHVAK
ncbi:hypothetical protein DUNSADRAFT_7142, partial [Dunaliella salina]